MAEPQLPIPSFAQALLAKEPKDRLEILQQEHPEYAEHKGSWQVLIDAFEGDGGFLDGSYLWPYPREREGDFKKRMSFARYQNYLAALVDVHVRFVFTQGVKRDSASEEFNAWLENVDGAGTGINDFLRRFASSALVCGHALALLDKTDDVPDGPSKADENARVIARIFQATDAPDWRFDAAAGLTQIKLLEVGPPPDLWDTVDGEDLTRPQYLLWADEGWVRFDHEGNLVGAGVTDLDLVPAVILRPKPSDISSMRGRPLISNANVIRALFNRCSEEDQVLRDQAFSVLTVSIDPNGDVDAAKRDLGDSVGTTSALVVKGEIDYKTPSQEVPAAIRENAEYLVRELYREAHVRYEGDSLDAESADAIRMKHIELNEVLQGFASALSLVEEQIARTWFHWQSATPEQADAAFEAAQVVAEYPEAFFEEDLQKELDAWQTAMRMGLGDRMGRRLKKRIVRRLEPDIPQDELDKIDAEIDRIPVDPPTMFALDTGQPDAISDEPNPDEVAAA